MDANGDGHGTMELLTTFNQNAVLTTDYDLVIDSGGNIRYFENYTTKTGGNFNDVKQTHGEGVMKPVAASSFASNNLAGTMPSNFPASTHGKAGRACRGDPANGTNAITSGHCATSIRRGRVQAVSAIRRL